MADRTEDATYSWRSTGNIRVTHDLSVTRQQPLRMPNNHESELSECVGEQVGGEIKKNPKVE